MAVGEPTRQDPSAPKVLAAQTRGAEVTKFAGGQIKGLSAAWTRSWQLLDSTLYLGGGTVRDFYNEYEYDARGYGHLGLELRAWVCGAPGAEVVAGSGVVATARCPM